MLVRVDWEWVLVVPDEGDPDEHVKAMLQKLEDVPVKEWPGEIAVARIAPIEPWDGGRWWQ